MIKNERCRKLHREWDIRLINGIEAIAEIMAEYKQLEAAGKKPELRQQYVQHYAGEAAGRLGNGYSHDCRDTFFCLYWYREETEQERASRELEEVEKKELARLQRKYGC